MGNEDGDLVAIGIFLYIVTWRPRPIKQFNNGIRKTQLLMKRKDL
jgi:hypothetical protein